MKKQKKNWFRTLLSYTDSCKGKMILSVLCAILSVIGGFIPYYCVYQILRLLIAREMIWENIVLWCMAGASGYLMQVLFHGIGTVLSHISAFTILEELRLRIAKRLMKAPLGEVMNRRIGGLKNIVVDKVEEIEIPLAH
ncbi:MAG: ABC transporter ATP-binding protein, partial [Lachnoclostridium sp.]|nr:ABC transporter ATP-binding protein [Lachnoclostridium sp.]